MTNLEIIMSTYVGKNSEENGRNLSSYAADNIIWTEAKGFPYGGTYKGIEAAVKNVFNRLATEWINYTFTPEGYLAEGDKICTYGTYSGINRLTGQPFEARVAHLWMLKDGRIISFEQFVDSQTANNTYKEFM